MKLAAAERTGRLLRWILLLLLGGWLVVWLVATWGSFLDDALIHARVADNLRATGSPAYNPGGVGTATSSPLFVWLLAASPLSTPVAAKCLSSAGLLLLLALIIWKGKPLEATCHFEVHLLLLALTSPFGLLWLTDGMETSLSVLLASAIGWAAGSCPASFHGVRGGLLLLASLALVLLRIDALLWVVPVVLALLVESRFQWKHAMAVAAGAALAAGAVWLAFGAILPDTAIAKQVAPRSVQVAVLSLGRSTLSAGLFGVGLTVVLILSLARATEATVRWRDRIALWLPTGTLAALAIVAGLRGQVIHGFRYLVVFLMGAIVFALARTAPKRTPSAPASFRGVPFAATALALLWIADASPAWEIARDRTKTAHRMRSLGLERLESTEGIAYDIGFVGYFSRARLVDLSGIANGSQWAEMPIAKRIENLKSRDIAFAFLTDSQRESVAGSSALEGLGTCERFRLRTRRHKDEYALLVRPSVARRLGLDCAEAGTRHAP